MDRCKYLPFYYHLTTLGVQPCRDKPFKRVQVYLQAGFECECGGKINGTPEMFASVNTPLVYREE